MANKKISELTNYTPATDTDEVAIVDKTTTTTKKITWANIKATLKTYFDSLYAAALGGDDNYVTDVEKAALHAAGSDTALGAQTENLDMNTHKVVGVVDPTTNQEAATKKYVDDNIPTVPSKATGAETDTGTDDAKFITPKAITDSEYFKSDETKILTNKRITKRTGTTTSSATPTINTDNVDFYSLTAQTEAITSFTTNLSGTPTENQTLWIAITGTAARAITWGASFEASTIALPTTTVTTARLDVGFVWNSVTSKWRCVAKA